MLTAVLCVLTIALLIVVMWVCHSVGYSSARVRASEAVFKAEQSRIDALKRVHDVVLDISKRARGPADMRNVLSKFIINELERKKK